MNNIKVKSYRYPRFHTENSSIKPVTKLKKHHKSVESNSNFVEQYSKIARSLEKNVSYRSPSDFSFKNILKLPSLTNNYSLSKIKSKSKKEKHNNFFKLPLQMLSSLHENKELKLNGNFIQIKPLIKHFNNLLDIRLNIDQSQLQIISAVKSYILQKNQSSISSFDSLFEKQEDIKLLKKFILLQRLSIIGLIYSIAQDPHSNVKVCFRHILDSILGFYLYILIRIKELPSAKNYNNLISTFVNNVQMQGIHLKKDLQSTIFFLLKKIPILYNKSQFLAYVLNTQYSKLSYLSIQKSFYDLLTSFAIYLNIHQQIIIVNRSNMDNFATCPAPYLFTQSDKKYTLVLQFEGILLKKVQNKDYALLRPFCQEFLDSLSKFYEIIIFTKFMPNEAQPFLKTLRQIDSCLYRYHTIRRKDKMYIDLTRIGRKMSKLIAIDNSVNDQWICQQQNVLYIHPWQGDPNDSNLFKLKQFLLSFTHKEDIDVRTQIQNIKNPVSK